jgi:hypothetical protein
MSNEVKKIIEDSLNESDVNGNPTSQSESQESAATDVSIARPSSFSLDKFKSKRGAAIANVETRPSRLSVHRISDANDFVRLHPDEENCWSTELCFVSVPVKDGKKSDNLHLIDEEIAMRYLESKKIKRFRLALATKPYDVHFLCIIPTRNLDNKFNETALKGCMDAKTLWTEVTSRKPEGYDEYKITHARNPKAFPEPKWPSQTFEEQIGITFEGRQIESNDHPGLLRLIGEKQDVS